MNIYRILPLLCFSVAYATPYCLEGFEDLSSFNRKALRAVLAKYLEGEAEGQAQTLPYFESFVTDVYEGLAPVVEKALFFLQESLLKAASQPREFYISALRSRCHKAELETAFEKAFEAFQEEVEREFDEKHKLEIAQQILRKKQEVKERCPSFGRYKSAKERKALEAWLDKYSGSPPKIILKVPELITRFVQKEISRLYWLACEKHTQLLDRLVYAKEAVEKAFEFDFKEWNTSMNEAIKEARLGQRKNNQMLSEALEVSKAQELAFNKLRKEIQAKIRYEIKEGERGYIKWRNTDPKEIEKEWKDCFDQVPRELWNFVLTYLEKECHWMGSDWHFLRGPGQKVRSRDVKNAIRVLRALRVVFENESYTDLFRNYLALRNDEEESLKSLKNKDLGWIFPQIFVPEVAESAAQDKEKVKILEKLKKSREILIELESKKGRAAIDFARQEIAKEDFQDLLKARERLSHFSQEELETHEKNLVSYFSGEAKPWPRLLYVKVANCANEGRREVTFYACAGGEKVSPLTMKIRDLEDNIKKINELSECVRASHFKENFKALKVEHLKNIVLEFPKYKSSRLQMLLEEGLDCLKAHPRQQVETLLKIQDELLCLQWREPSTSVMSHFSYLDTAILPGVKRVIVETLLSLGLPSLKSRRETSRGEEEMKKIEDFFNVDPFEKENLAFFPVKKESFETITTLLASFSLEPVKQPSQERMPGKWETLVDTLEGAIDPEVEPLTKGAKQLRELACFLEDL